MECSDCEGIVTKGLTLRRLVGCSAPSAAESLHEEAVIHGRTHRDAPTVDVPTGGGAPSYLDELRFLTFGRAVPACLFGLLGWKLITDFAASPSLRHFLAAPTLGGLVGGPLAKALYILFCVIPVGIYLTRERPRARDGRIIVRAAALTGTVMLLVAGVVVHETPIQPPEWVGAASSAMALASILLAVLGLLYLRRNLSIIPEARALVTGGPYRVVRHPLYLAEIGAAVSQLIGGPAPIAAGVVCAFIAVQLGRAQFEEALLERTFPQYAEYRRRTWRLLPLIW